MTRIDAPNGLDEPAVEPRPTQWQVFGRRTVYASWWVELHVDSVRLNDGSTIEHEVVVAPQDAAGMVVINEARELLMIYRHRFIPDTWGWEFAAGRIEPNEAPIDGAVRECQEETGYRVGDVEPLTSWHPSSGFSNQQFHAFLARSVLEVGEPTEVNEAIRIEWRPADVVADDLMAGRIPDGFTQLALMRAFAHLGWSLDGGTGELLDIRNQTKAGT